MKVYVKRHQMKGDRLAAFAHDIRTPMCCVSGAAQMAMMQSRRGADVSAQMEQILTAVQAMDRMLSQLCDVKQTTRNTVFTRNMLTRELLALIGEAARRKEQVLSVDLIALGEDRLTGDYAALVRVLTNLLENAVKYTPSGGLISLHAARTDEGSIRFSVRDSGIGMRPEFLTKLFIPFERAQETAHLPGRGLGLSIAKELIERMGGTISVESEWGTGTKFDVCVQLG